MKIPLLDNDNKVINVIEAEYTDPVPKDYTFGPNIGMFDIGWFFNGENYVNLNPIEYKEELPKTYYLKKQAFYDRFGEAKYDILMSDDPEIRSLIAQTWNSKYIDLDYPGLAEGVYWLNQVKNFNFDVNIVLSRYILPDEEYFQI